MLRTIAPQVAVVCCVVLAGCTSAGGRVAVPADSGRLRVAVSFYPIEEIVDNVGGDQVEVIELTPAGSEPHDLEMSPQTAAQLEQANVVFYLGHGFQPTVEKAIASLGGDVVKVDLLNSVETIVEAGQVDPHIWLDPINMIAMTDDVASTLSTAHADGSTRFQAHAAAYSRQLAALADEFSAKLAHCQSRTVVISHRSFAYLTTRMDLDQLAIVGISPDEEPAPKRLQAVAESARRLGVSTVFSEARVSDGLASTVADEIDATTAALDPIESITSSELTAGASYISLQRANLAALVGGLRCG